MRYSVLIVEEQNVPRKYLETVIRTSQNFIHIGSLCKPDGVMKFCQTKKPDMVLTDILFESGCAGFGLTERIKSDCPEIKVIALTDKCDRTLPERARKSGADSFCYMQDESEPVLSVMEKTVKGEHIYPVCAPSVKFGYINSNELTSRETEVLCRLIKGEGNEKIGEHLGISTDTVKFHIKSMFQKTGFCSRTELAAQASAKGIVITD